MAQLTNPAGRIDHAPADLTRSLAVIGAIATVLLITLVIVVQALAPQTRGPVVGRVAPPAVSAPYDGRLDPIEWKYIRQAHGPLPIVATPRAVSAPYDGHLDPIEWRYIQQSRGLRPVVSAPHLPTSVSPAPYAPNSRGTQQHLIAE
jgi:hypothetical protein